MGPISFFGRRPGDKWRYLNDLSIPMNTPEWGKIDTEYAISAEDLGRNHTFIVSFEANAGITYEVELVRHWEIVPAEDSPFEVRDVMLPDNYSSTLDLIRRYKIAQLTSNPFAITRISTKMDNHTPWSMDPILTEQLLNIREITR